MYETPIDDVIKADLIKSPFTVLLDFSFSRVSKIAILETLEKEKSNNTVKGDLIKSAFITSSMGVSYKLKLGKSI